MKNGFFSRIEKHTDSIVIFNAQPFALNAKYLVLVRLISVLKWADHSKSDSNVADSNPLKLTFVQFKPIEIDIVKAFRPKWKYKIF